MFLSAFYLPTTVVGIEDTVKKKKNLSIFSFIQLKCIVSVPFVHRYCVEC